MKDASLWLKIGGGENAFTRLFDCLNIDSKNLILNSLYRLNFAKERETLLEEGKSKRKECYAAITTLLKWTFVNNCCGVNKKVCILAQKAIKHGKYCNSGYLKKISLKQKTILGPGPNVISWQ